MKISDLVEKGPIIGAPKGSQKDARLTPGTDDPSKYMRGGEWEAYREPQGVNSPAGKIAGGTKKGTTKTKNKKMSEGPILPAGGPGASGDAVPRHRDATTINMVKDTNADTRKSTPMANNKAPMKQARAKVRKSLTDTPGNVIDINELFDYQTKMNPDPHGGGLIYDVDGMDWKAGVEPSGNFFIVPWDKTAPTYVKDNRTSGHALKAFSTGFNWLVDEIKNGKINEPINIATSDVRLGRIFRKMSDRVAKMTGWQLDVGENGNANRAPRMTLSPTRAVEAISEAISRQQPREYNADYTLRNDRDTEDLGEARIRYGVIELLACRNDVLEDFNGHVMSRLMSTIVSDADLANANLAIQLDDPSDIQHKRFMERFGFRETENGIMKRNAGSVRPPSVPTARL